MSQSSLPPPLPLQASKWLKVPVLLNAEEMTRLFAALGPCSIFHTSGVHKSGEEKISHEVFLEVYKEYVVSLKAGNLPDEQAFRSFFSGVLTVDDSAVFTIPVESGKCVVRVSHPVVQMQNHRFDYSEVDHQYRSMVYGQDSVLWGIQFSYPQLVQDPVTKDAKQVGNSAEFPNTRLFRTLQKWVRDHTVATPLVAHEIRTNVPIRLGKECFSWINNHPQLMKKKLKVVDYGKSQR